MKENIKNNYVNKIIKNIKVFDINNSYIEFPNKKGYSIDGGIEIHFEKEVLTFGWNFKKERFDLQSKPFSKLSEENKNYSEVDLKNFYLLENLKKKKIINLKLVTNEFDTIIDYTLKTEKLIYYTGLLISFENNYKVKISSSSYIINKKTQLPVQIIPSLNSELIIEFGNSFGCSK